MLGPKNRKKFSLINSGILVEILEKYFNNPDSIDKSEFDLIASYFDVDLSTSAGLSSKTNSDDDYILFCENNRKNDKIKSLSLYFVNLMKLGVIDVSKIFNLINLHVGKLSPQGTSFNLFTDRFKFVNSFFSNVCCDLI